MKILCLKTRVMIPNMREKVERRRRRSFLVENPKQFIMMWVLNSTLKGITL